MYPFSRTRVTFEFLIVTATLAVGGLAADEARKPEGEAPGPQPPWAELVSLNKPEGNLSLTAPWDPQKGIKLMVREKEGDRRVVLHWLPAKTRMTLQSGDDESVVTRHRFRPEARPGKTETCAVLLKLRDSAWSLYLDGVLAARYPAMLQPPATAHWPTGTAPLSEARPRFQPVSAIRFYSDFMIEPDAPNQLYPWKPQSGNWRIHTVRTEAEKQAGKNLKRVKQVPPKPEQSPNFYCLKGKGSGAVITTGYDFYDRYRLAASIQLDDGEAGLVFHHGGADHFYAFTMQVDPEAPREGRLVLWEKSGGDRRTLCTVETPLWRRQWYMPAVQVGDGRIRCYLDNVLVAEVPAQLPPGGKIGLWTETEQETRFDDIRCTSTPELRTDSADWLRFNRLAASGRTHLSAAGETNPAILALTATPKKPARYILGRPWHQNVVFAADVEAGQGNPTVSLVAGAMPSGAIRYRFDYRRAAGKETVRLIRMEGKKQHTVTEWARPLAEDPPASVTLMTDASEAGRLRCYRDGDLVAVDHYEGELTGGAGIEVTSDSKAAVKVSQASYRFDREKLYLETHQQNKEYRDDPFMRHWSSPEGEWIADDDGLRWHKGDFYAGFRVQMPVVDDSELHVGISEGETDGDLVVDVKDGIPRLRIRLGDEERLAAVPEAVVKEKKPAQYTLYVEDFWTWLMVDGAPVLTERLSRPLQGTRARVAGFSTSHLAKSRVRRRNMQCDYFTESPHDWIAHGGKWQIINRFQCRPSWSHMVGESADGMAALWHKFRYSGNVTLEFYAGIRHGWYDYHGDLNCTILSESATPGSGYTVTCTERDHNLAQKWSTLYRRGDVVGRSDVYTVPRTRQHNRRKIRNPLIADGRPIHGAWYYIKMRRIGSACEFYFDNERIFSFDDPDALRSGLTGIWTFMNAMTVACVRISFDHAEPRSFPFEVIMPGEARPEKEPAGAAPFATVSAGDTPLDALNPQWWTLEEDAGQSTLSVYRRQATVLRAQTQLGGGKMFLAGKLPPLPLKETAGWRFELKRSPGAALNAHYTIGTVNKGKYTPQEHFFHRISGAGFSGGKYEKTGDTRVPGADDWPELKSGWHTVTAWVPSRIRKGPEDDRYVRFEGLGNRRKTHRLAGIKGAKPGGGYAVRRFAPVRYGAPLLTGIPEKARIIVRRRPDGPRESDADAPEKLSRWFAKSSKPGINSYWLSIKGSSRGSQSHPLTWVELPENVPFSFGWAKKRAGTALLQAKTAYPDPRFAKASVQLKKNTLPLQATNAEQRFAVLPRPPAGGAMDKKLTFHVNPGTGSVARTLNREKRPMNAAPVLLDLHGLTPTVFTFEGEQVDEITNYDAARMTVIRKDARPHFLRIMNHDLGQRLDARFRSALSVAQYPILSFRYRAGDMVNISAQLDSNGYARISEDAKRSTEVRLADSLRNDKQWDVWQGFVSDAFTETGFDLERFETRVLRLASLDSPDQTGRYSWLDLDFLVFGPAVSAPEQLRCTPRYADADGVDEVYYAISAPSHAYRGLSEKKRSALKWVRAAPGKPVTPDLAGLSDGVHHLLLKAVDMTGRESRVTDIPFVLDTTAPDVTSTVQSIDDPVLNGTRLTIRITHDGASPWAAGETAFQLNGEEKELHGWGSTFSHGKQAEVVHLNYPFVFRNELNAAADGDVLTLSLHDVQDGAGNKAGVHKARIKVDYESDKHGPSWYHTDFGSSVLWKWNWDGRQSAYNAFHSARYNKTSVVLRNGQSPYLDNRSTRRRGDITRKISWKPADYPYLAFRMRMPKYEPAEKSRALLMLESNYGRFRITLNGSGNADGKRILATVSDEKWGSSAWRPLMFNIEQSLQDSGFAQSRIEKLKFKSIRFYRRNSGGKDVLHLDDFFVFRVPAGDDAKDVMQAVAFDASGVEAVRFTCRKPDGSKLWEETVKAARIDLSQMRSRAQADTWLECHVIDKPGNLSVPAWVPFPKGG